MEFTVWQKIKTGFWLGMGFIVPFLIMYMISFGIALFSTKFTFEQDIEETAQKKDSERIVESSSNQIKSTLEDQIKFKSALEDQMKIISYRESVSGNRLLILGELMNNGPETANSFQLQVELFNKNDQFVYECNEYFSKRLNKGEKENFQIKCGCGEETIPNYTSLTVRILKANKY